MSTNLLYNPKFDLPLINTNTFERYATFTPAQISALYWLVVDNNSVTLQNGVTAYDFPSPSLINNTQAICFQYAASISQTVTIFDLVTYQLRFNYVCRPSPYLINPLNIYFNDVLAYTASTYSSTWSEVIIDYTPSDFGNLTIKFETIDDPIDKAICFTNIKFLRP